MLENAVFCPVCGAGPYRSHGGRFDHMRKKHGVTMIDYQDALKARVDPKLAG